MKKIINLINKIYFNTLDLGSHGKEFIFVKNVDQITGFKFDNNSKLPFKNNSIKAIYCSHVIEHLFDDTIKNLLKECYRVLKNGGVFRVVTIDFQKLHKLLVENKTEELSIQSGSVGSYEIKGVWYFDKKHSELRYRLLGIHARTASIADLKNGVTDPDLNADSGLWIWYPSIREELDKSLVFNERNNNSKISFDELLINRRFDSYIYKYDNVYGNREIEQYIVKRPGESDERLKLRRLLESERIKKEILDFEIDMWGY